MATPTIKFNNSTGSDTAASGAGPATALTGSAASFSGTTVTLSGSPDLSGVATDGSHALYLVTSTGRRFFSITGKNVGAFTVTVASAPAGTTTGLTWAIGGKRLDPFSATSSLLFTADANGGWVLELEHTGSNYTFSEILTLGVSGDKATGYINLRGAAGGTKPTVEFNNTANKNDAINGGSRSFWQMENLVCNHSGTHNLVRGFITDGASTFSRIRMIDIDFVSSGSGTSGAAMHFSGNNTIHSLLARRCTFTGPWNTGMSFANTGVDRFGVNVLGCRFTGLLGSAVACGRLSLTLLDSIINGCGGAAVTVSGGNARGGLVANTLFHDNASDAVLFNSSVNCEGWTIQNCIFTNNGGYGINSADTVGPHVIRSDYNVFGTGATANTSGTVNTGVGLTLGANDQIADPQYADEPGGDFTPTNAALEGTAFPVSIP